MDKIKRVLIVLLVVALSISFFSCTQSEPEPEPEPEPEVEEPVVEEEPEPDVFVGTTAIPGVRMLYSTCDRGTVVNVTGVDGDYYTIDMDGLSATIEKRFVRLDSEEPFEEYDGILKEDANAFETAYMTGEPGLIIPEDSEVKVLDSFADVILVSFENNEWYISNETSIKDTREKESSGKKSSGGGSTSSDVPAASEPASDPQPAPSDGADGGDIDMSGLLGVNMTDDYGIVLLSSETYEEEIQETFTPETGTVLSKGTEVYLGFIAVGEKYTIIEYDDNIVTILLNDGVTKVTVPRWAILMDGEEPFAEYDLYALDGITGSLNNIFGVNRMTIEKGTKLHVLKITDQYYIVQLDDGNIVYLKIDDELASLLSEEEPVIEEEKETKKEKKSKSSSDSGSSDPAVSPEPSPEPETEAEWTEEVL